MIYLPRASPLHATRAAVASAWCVVLALVALSFDHPLVLAALLGVVVAAAAAARVARRVLIALAFTLPLALAWGLLNPLVTREGLTVIARLGELPVLGQVDLTAEATAYGGVLALRTLVVIGCFALHSAAVDPDDLLRAFRRLSFRSALTAALATRLVPVLARDARRLRDAQRGLAEPAPRRAVVRAVAGGALDRAVDVAATLEVRGYGVARRAPRGAGRPWSRHDLAFAASAVALAAIGIAAWAGDAEAFDAYPSFAAPVGPAQLGLCAVLALCALLPFADRRGIGR